MKAQLTINETLQYFVKVTTLIMEKYREYLNSESLEWVSHYLNHNEPEIAFEALFSSLLKKELVFEKNEFEYYIALAKLMKLNGDDVMDRDFWGIFVNSPTYNP